MLKITIKTKGFVETSDGATLVRAMFNFSDHEGLDYTTDYDKHELHLSFKEVDWRVFNKLENLWQVLDRFKLLEAQEEVEEEV